MRDDTDMLATIAQQIEDAINADEPMARMPWHGHVARPRNFQTGEPYRGGNCLRLWFRGEINGFSSGVWGTYNQFAKFPAGGVYQGVAKGSKNLARIVKYVSETKVAKTGEEYEDSRFIWYKVYNLLQTSFPMDDLPLQRHSKPLQKRVYGEVCAQVTPSGNLAYDALIAEIALAFVLADQGFSAEPMKEHGQYLRAWLAILRTEDKTDPTGDHFRLTVAASEAAKIADKIAQAALAA